MDYTLLVLIRSLRYKMENALVAQCCVFSHVLGLQCLAHWLTVSPLLTLGWLTHLNFVLGIELFGRRLPALQAPLPAAGLQGRPDDPSPKSKALESGNLL